MMVDTRPIGQRCLHLIACILNTFSALVDCILNVLNVGSFKVNFAQPHVVFGRTRLLHFRQVEVESCVYDQR